MPKKITGLEVRTGIEIKRASEIKEEDTEAARLLWRDVAPPRFRLLLEAKSENPLDEETS